MTPTLDFGFALGMGSAGGLDGAVAVTTDSAGNFIVGGGFEDTVDFDPGPGVRNLTEVPVAGDAFLAKYSSSGALLWAHSFGAYWHDTVQEVAVDAANNVYAVGVFRETIDFDPGPGQARLSSPGEYSTFALKMTAAGNLLWAKQFSGTSTVLPEACTVDAAGNLSIAGYLNHAGNADIDPGPGVVQVDCFGTDTFFVQLDASGNFVWGAGLGPSNYQDAATAIGTDAAGNVYLGGRFSLTLDFDPGPGVFNMTAAGTVATQTVDSYLMKLDSAGRFLWAKRWGSDTYVEDVTGLTVDPAGNVYVTGWFSRPTDLDPGPGVFELTPPAGRPDIFVSKFDSAGNFLWARNAGGVNDDKASSIAFAGGKIFVTGTFARTADFDPGPATYQMTAPDTAQAFVLQLDANGNFLAAAQLGGPDVDRGMAIAVHGRDVYTVGDRRGIGDFDPGPGAFDPPFAGYSDVWISKLLDRSPATNQQLYAVSYLTNQLLTIDTVTGAGTVVASLSGSGGAIGLGWLGSNLYVANQGMLRVDPLTGSTITNIDVGIPLNAEGDVAFRSDGIGFAMNGPDDLYRFDVNSPATTALLGQTSTNLDGLAFDANDVLFGLSEGGQELYTIDQNTGALTLVGATGITASVTIGGLAFDAVGNLFAVVGSAGGPSTLYAIDPANGAATSIGAVGAAPDIAGISFTTVGAAPGIVLNQTGGSTGITEGGATDTYTVSLATAPSATVTISLTRDGQVAVAPATLIFTPANWNTPQTVTVTAVDDTVVEGTHTGVITHDASSSDSSYGNLAPRSLTATIADNDAPSVRLNPAAGITVIEGSTRTYSATLNVAPTQNVTVTLAPDPGLQVSPATLVFSASNWSVPQTVSVSYPNNSTPDGILNLNIAHTLTGDSSFAATGPVLPVTVIDDDSTLIIEGTEKSDKITVTFSTNIVQVAVNSRVTFYPNTFTLVQILAHNGVNRIQIANPTAAVMVVGGAARDEVILDGRASANAFTVDTVSVNVNGQDISLADIDSVLVSGKTAADTFTIADVPAYAVTIQAGGGKDTLIAPDLANNWRITASDAGTLNGTIAFTFVENLTGGSDDDSFWFAAGRFASGVIDGGAGANTLDFSAHKTALTFNLQPATPTINTTRPFRNIATLVGGAGLDKLIGANQSNTWNITGSNAGDVGGLTFRSIENLTGGNLDDTFLFADGQGIQGKLDGAAGTDALDFSTFSTFVTVNLQTKQTLSAGGRITFANLESFTGGAATDTLIGANRANHWTLNDVGTGTTTGATFAGYENLTGGTLIDTFDFAAAGDWLGLLDGGAGSDVLNALAGWTYTSTGPNAGTLNGRSFRGVETRR